MPKPTRSRLLRDNAFSAQARYNPAIKAIREQHGEDTARRVMVAKALDDARRKGARIPKP